MQYKRIQEDQPQYFPFIDGLRALAVIAVIIYHLNAAWLPGGFVGVDVFFVISGFVVSASITHFKGQGFWRFLAFFYARRIKRIFPALIVCLLITCYVSALFIPSSWLSDVNQQTGLFAFVGLSNFILAANRRDYFAPTTEFNPFTHTWSLGVEEQFYLIFPILFVAWLHGQRGRKASAILFAVGLLISLIFSAWESQANPTNAYFLIPGRFWELASGVLLYQLVTLNSAEEKRKENRLSGPIALIALAGLFVAFAISTPDNFPMPGAVIAVISTLLLLFSLYKQNSFPWLHRLLGNRYILFFGKTSYSLYLWHWPVFVLFRWTYGLETPLTKALAVALTLVMATFSFYIVETPMRRSKMARQMPNPAIIAVGFCVIAISWWGASAMNARAGKISLSQVSADADLWYPDRGPATPDSPGCRADPQTIIQDGVEVMVFKPEGCVQEKASRYRVLHVIGDSHTLAYAALYKQFAIRNNLEVDVYRNGGCPFISFQSERDIDNLQCREQAENSLHAIHQRIQPGDVLFLASLRLPRFSDQWAYFGSKGHQQSFFSAQAEENRQRSVDYAIDKLRSFVDQGVHVVFEAPKPIFSSPPFRCSDWFNRSNPICAKGMTMPQDLLQKYRALVLASYNKVIRALPAVAIWDPFPILCDGPECHAWKNGHSMFFDGDHLSAFGSMRLLPSFSEFMLPKLEKSAQSASSQIPAQGYQFNQPGVPDFLESFSGLSHAEDWGRWSDGNSAPAVVLSFIQPLPKGFTLQIISKGYGPNIGHQARVIVDNEEQRLNLGEQATEDALHFANHAGAKRIEIIPPSPQSPKDAGESTDGRKLGIGLLSIKIIAD